MRSLKLTFGIMLVCSQAYSQIDAMMLMNPLANREKIIIRNEISASETVKDGNEGDDFGLASHDFALRYGMILERDREFYLMVDSLVMDIDSDGRFDGNQVSVPDHLSDVSVGLMYRQTVHETWKFAGTARIGSASDELFHSSDEMYLRSLLTLRIPHTETKSWVLIGSIDTDREYPVMPGIGYAFPIKNRAYALIGIPFFGAAGNFNDKIGFQFSYRPLRNADARVDYQLTEKIKPYIGFKWQGMYFAREDRKDSDDRIYFEDRRVFVGATAALSKSATLDVKTGLIMLREIGEGEDRDELNDNDIDIDDAWFGSLALNFRFR